MLFRSIFVTTSYFDKKARASAEKSDKRLRLIDGEELTLLMIEYNVGTSITNEYAVKILDNDYFDR